MTVAEREIVIADLRARIARLGGLPGGRRAAGAVAYRSTDLPRPSAPVPSAPGLPSPLWSGESADTDHQYGVRASARRLGFEPDMSAGKPAWVRSVLVDLRPHLERAGATRVPGAHVLGDLMGVPTDATRRESAGGFLVLDIETLGLRGSGVVAFLVGLGEVEGAEMRVSQFLLVDLGGESALLDAVINRVRAAAMLVTYNGRTFDLPVLRSRCVVSRRDPDPLDAPLHCDLLAPVRRMFRDRLGMCTLRQAELNLLSFERVGDVPGNEAPSRYRWWLREGIDSHLAGVVEHNHLDLCATAVLAVRLAAHVSGCAVQPTHAADAFRLGTHWERLGVWPRAEQHYRVGMLSPEPWGSRATHRLVRGLRRRPEGQAEARSLLRGLVRGDPLDLGAARQLAVVAERAGELGEAAAVTAAALDACRQLGPWRLERMRGAPSGGWLADWRRRSERLARRSEASIRRHRSPQHVRPGGFRPPDMPLLSA